MRIMNPPQRKITRQLRVEKKKTKTKEKRKK